MIKEKATHILAELRGHAPFTFFGALIGIIFMIVFKKLGQPHAETLFKVFHPTHVLLSAMVTASIFELHRKAKNFILILLIGYIGSIGIATVSDCVLPFIGESLLGLHIPTHAEVHSEDDGHIEDHGEDEAGSDRPALHIGFIEDWYIVNPAAILGVIIAYFLPRTKFPHAGHVLISTWASSSHILMNTVGDLTVDSIVGIFAILFVAVWIPCCISDIIFPLLFVKSDLKLTSACHVHGLHSHPHEHNTEEQTE